MKTLVISGCKGHGSFDEFERDLLYHLDLKSYDQIACYIVNSDYYATKNPAIFQFSFMLADKYNKNKLILKSAEDFYSLANDPSTGYISFS